MSPLPILLGLSPSQQVNIALISHLSYTALVYLLPCLLPLDFCGVHLSLTFITTLSVALHVTSQGPFTESFTAPQGKRDKWNRKNCDLTIMFHMTAKYKSKHGFIEKKSF